MIFSETYHALHVSCSRIKLEESGLKVYLHQLIFEDSEDNGEHLGSTGRSSSSSSKAVVPLQLRLLYGDDELLEAKRFHVSTTASADNQNTTFYSQADILSRSKRRLYPSHGTSRRSGPGINHLFQFTSR